MPTLNDLKPKDAGSDVPTDDPSFFAQAMTFGVALGLASTERESPEVPKTACEILEMAGRPISKEDARFWDVYRGVRALGLVPARDFDFETLRDEGWAPDEARMAAANALANSTFRSPVHLARWPMVLPVLVEEAELRGWEPQTELNQRVVENLFHAIEAVRLCDPTEPDTWRVLRGEINRLVTEDLLGPAWRRTGGEKGLTDLLLPEEEEFCAVEPVVEQVDAELTLAALIDTAALSPKEAQVVAHLRRGERLNEIADLLAISPSTARVHWHRAIKKLRPV